jgi:hypothetical protein
MGRTCCYPIFLVSLPTVFQFEPTIQKRGRTLKYAPWLSAGQIEALASCVRISRSDSHHNRTSNRLIVRLHIVY